MKTIVRITLLSVLIFKSSIAAQWQQTGGPGGGTIYAFASKGTLLFAGLDDGVYRSTNSGETWTKAGLKDISISSLFVNVNMVFAGTPNGKVFRSTDDGVNWTELVANFPPVTVTSFAVSGSFIFVAFDDEHGQGRGGVYRSTDNGESWSTLNVPIPGRYRVFDLAVTGPFIFAATGDDGVYRSTNNGESWAAVNSGFNDISCVALGVSSVPGDTTVFAGTFYNLYRSTNNGESWGKANIGLPTFPDVRGFVVDSNVLFAATGNGVYRSTDNGEQWTEMNAGLTRSEVFCIESNGNYLFTGTYEAGVHRSPDNGLSWAPMNSGLSNAAVFSLVINGITIFTGTGGGVYRSTDIGDNWRYAGLFGQVNALAVKDGKVFVGTNGAGIYQSTDDGQSWIPVNSGLPEFAHYVQALNVYGTYLFAGTWEGVFRSSNDGASWMGVNSGISNFVRVVNTFAADGNRLFAGTGTYLRNSDLGGVYVSTNNGDQWTVTSLAGPHWVRSIAVGNGVVWAGTGGLLSGGLFRSTNNGMSWTDIGGGLPGGSPNVYALLFYAGELFAGTAVGVYRSSDDGDIWTDDNEGLPPNAVITALTTDGQYLFACTRERSVWRRLLSPVVSVGDGSSQIPQSLYLHQNYPNPFNPTTTITFEIPVGTRHAVSLRVYDVLGCEVATLVNEELKPGSYEKLFDGSNLPSRVYIYRITAGSFTDAKKMVLLR